VTDGETAAEPMCLCDSPLVRPIALAVGDHCQPMQSSLSFKHYW